MRNAECGMWNSECGIRNVEYSVNTLSAMRYAPSELIRR